MDNINGIEVKMVAPGEDEHNEIIEFAEKIVDVINKDNGTNTDVVVAALANVVASIHSSYLYNIPIEIFTDGFKEQVLMCLTTNQTKN